MWPDHFSLGLTCFCLSTKLNLLRSSFLLRTSATNALGTEEVLYAQVLQSIGVCSFCTHHELLQWTVNGS